MAQLRNSDRAYGIIAQALHWCTAGLLLSQFALGLYAADLPLSLARLQWLTWHKSLGITILMLMLARLLWRLFDAPPPLPEKMSWWERDAAHAVHWVLYAVSVLAMLAGWLYASAAGLSIKWFGWLLIPDLLEKDTVIAPLFKELHHALVALLALLVLGHVGAALRHAFLLRDGMMRRMLPTCLRRER